MDKVLLNASRKLKKTQASSCTHLLRYIVRYCCRFIYKNKNITVTVEFFHRVKNVLLSCEHCLKEVSYITRRDCEKVKAKNDIVLL